MAELIIITADHQIIEGRRARRYYKQQAVLDEQPYEDELWYVMVEFDTNSGWVLHPGTHDICTLILGQIAGARTKPKSEAIVDLRYHPVHPHHKDDERYAGTPPPDTP